ncbi:unnamed protein product [Parnassius apollo]|uniref:(apollo) hypothetical protein n=1 Tax=Parnassius apollo TaxID=110799 RepID=A0A8S3XN06_PARAO|nr:unnamed protein product [Parnassius apollo]
MSDSKKDRLAKKRLSERRRKARIKSDPELYVMHKEKDIQRYCKRKNEGKIKSVSELDLVNNEFLEREVEYLPINTI